LSEKYSRFLFNAIAPIYSLIFNRQKKHFEKHLANAEKDLALTSYKTILDVGCGNGALCAVLDGMGLSVTGIEPAEKMFKTAKKKLANRKIQVYHASILDRLPFENDHFDVSIASYVVHGLQKEDRKRMYAEMSRVSRYKVFIHDYNQSRNLITTIVEWIERGGYFEFIKSPEHEMKSCFHEMQECFSEIKVVTFNKHSAWYICTPSSKN